MITTFTPNPSIDKTLTVDGFDIYRVNRVQVLRSDFGGKGINVSTALHNLDVETCCTGFSFEHDDAALRAEMQRRGLPFDFVVIPGAMRTCFKIFDQSIHHTIDINESSQEIDPAQGKKLLDLLKKHAAASNVIVLSGSLPKGLDSDFYYQCVEAIHSISTACKVVVDAERKLLLNALEAHPNILKPNINEFQDTFGVTISSSTELDTTARDIARRYKLDVLCVSLGAEGAYITDGNESWQCDATKVEVRSIQGAGDSVVAGMCAALEQKLPLPELLRYGIAAAGDSISRDGTQFCTKDGLAALLKQNINLRKVH